jgi:uncharacterized membrane protein
MPSLYFSLKFIHVAAVIFWIGGIAALTIMVLRAGREENPSALVTMMGMSQFFGQRVIGPASGVALLAGIGMVIEAKIGFLTLWVLWGLSGFVLHVLLGVTVIRKNSMRLGQIAAQPTRDLQALQAVLSRQKTLATVYLLSMLTVVWAMVTKPT